MKLPKFTPGKKLQATARRVRAGLAASEKAGEDYEEQEPNMRFSSAFLVVLLLHVTAFGGIWAFDKVKARRAAPLPIARTAAASSTTATASRSEGNTIAKVNRTTEAESTSATAHAKRGESNPAKTRTAATTVAPAAEKADPSAKPAMYVVAKGDNPVSIAHQFGVSYDELLKLNNIEDPKKLQIGQKLKIPTKKVGDTTGKLTSQVRTAE